MRKRLVICVFLIAFCILAGFVSAGKPEVNANDVISRVDPGEEFDVNIFIDCHANVANYTVKITGSPRFRFVEDGSDMVISGSNASITKMGFDEENLRFKFPMMALNNTPDGDFSIHYEAYWNGSETGFVPELVESDSVRVSVGEGGEDSPCSSAGFVILPVLAVGTAFSIVKKGSR